MADSHEEHETLLSISEVADLLGIAPSALRYYERKGLITPKRSRWSNYRGYGPVELFEITDIIHYRNAGIAVNNLGKLFRSPIAETLETLDAEIDRKLEELEDLRLTLAAASHLSQRIRRRMTLGTIQWRESSEPPFAHLTRIEEFDREFLEEYLRRYDEIRYAALFPEPGDSSIFFDCMCADSIDAEKTVWSAQKGARYVEFLLTTAYGETDKNDLEEWRAALADEGIRIGRVAAEYLTYDVDPATGKRFDCYDAWAEVL